MSDHRNLNRWFRLNKAMRMYGKESGVILNYMELSVLLGLSHLLKKVDSVGLILLCSHLRYYNRSMSDNQAVAILRRFMSLGFVERRGIKYVLSLSGMNVLNDIEIRCRETVKVYV